MNRIAIYATAVALFLSVFVASWAIHENLSIQTLIQTSFSVRDGKNRVMMDLLDAETGQRGFMMTGDETYLLPYFRATAELPKDLQSLTDLKLDGRQSAFVDALQPLVTAKMDELRRTIDLLRSGNAAEAIAVIKGGQGKIMMDKIRDLIATDRAASRPARHALQARSNTLIQVTLYSGIAAILLLVALTALLARRAPPPVPAEIRRHQQSLDSIERSIAALLTHDESAEAKG